MSAYMIVTADISDREPFINGYGQAASALVAQFGGRYILMGAGAELLEGNFGNDASMVISEWPDKETALRFWNSPEYQEVKKMRAGMAECQVLVIEAPRITSQGSE